MALSSAPTRALAWPNISTPLALCAVALGFSGSSIYVLDPLRPFHFGAALILALIALDREWRRAVLDSALTRWLAATAAVLLIQLLWIEHTDRYLRFLAFLLTGVCYTVLADALVRRRVDFAEGLYPIVLYWLITAAIPIYDAWTGSGRFRMSYPLTGGVWYNINDMATALVFANLIWLLIKRKLSLPLYLTCWFYALAMNRRTILLAASVLGLLYLLGYARRLKHGNRALLAGALLATSAAALVLHHGNFQFGTLPSLAPRAQVGAGAVLTPASTAATDETIQSAQTGEDIPPVDEIGVIANNGDHSTAYRVQLLLDMYAQIRDMPWWQWAFGLGLGQLNLMWPATDAQWASPHFFWLEMFFHLGLLWVAFLGWLLVRSDSTGRICLITAAIAGMAPSSMIYLQPFWFLVGVCVAVLPQKNGAPSRPAAFPQHASQ
ncbi:hypothetical protein [Bordetella bronchiseptica]|uniref:hypothetical protein n=1 Tax=Bordetella bronchiseptica TaxID=518 RepID=UPI001F38D443|nr:hypothetical protein [Bordetella bronchiseptica]